MIGARQSSGGPVGVLTRWLGLSVVALLSGGFVLAQTTGRIEGRIVDTDGRVLPGVSVSVSSPSLQGTKAAVSESDGLFRFPALPPGNYLVKAELSGFNPLEVPAVSVTLDRTASLELSMIPVQREAVVVTAEAPMIDRTDASDGADFRRRLFENIPTGRTYQSLAFAAPTVIPSGLPDSPSIMGASGAENRYVVDGLDVTDPAFGVSGSSLAFEFIDEVQVKTGGYQVDYSGALGGVINVLTKSGGNDFRGDVFGYFNSDALEATAKTSVEYGQTVGLTRYDFGADAGGKLIQDKLWYFGAINPSISDVDQLTRQENPYTERLETLYFAGKLTWNIASQHRIVASGFGDPSETDNASAFQGMFPPFNTRNAAGLLVHNTKQGGYGYGLTYDVTPTSNLLGELTLGRYQQRLQFLPVQNTSNPYIDLTPGGSFAVQQGCGDPDLVADAGVSFTPGCLGGVWVAEKGDRSRNQLRAAVSAFLGGHSLKVGIEYRHSEYTDVAHTAGPTSGPLVDANGVVVDSDGIVGGSFQLNDGFYILRVDDYASDGTTEETGVFVSDEWQILSNLTVNAGVRFDSLQSAGNGTTLHPDRRFDFSLGEMIAPRASVIWDPFKQGRSRVFANYGQFSESIPMDVNDYAFGNARIDLYYFDYPRDGSLPSYTNLGAFQGPFPILLGLAVDPSISPPYTEEVSVGLEHEFSPGFTIGLRGIDRHIRSVVEDISVDNTATYFVTNPGGLYTVNPVTGDPLAVPVTFPTAERKYQALELTANKRLGDSWQIFGSYVYSSNEGNYGGLFRQDNGQLTPNLTTVFDLPRLLVGAYGPLPNDRPHQVKLYGSYTWPFPLTTGLLAQYLSGTPISQFGADTVYGPNERFVTPRGAAGRTDGLFQLDLHLAYALPLGDLFTATLIADLFNVTNGRTETAVDQTWTFGAPSDEDPATCGGPGSGPGTDCPQGNPNWGQPISYQQPFRARLGVRLSW
jgi:hypothetical protein